MSRKVQAFTLSIFFLSAISLPLIIMFFSKPQEISYMEKRKLAEKPAFSFSHTALTAYPKKYEEYFNDHFGLRSNLVSLYNHLFISIFETSPQFPVIVGKDKWLFLAADFVLNDFLGLHQFNANRLHQWKQILLDREEWLADKGIKYLFLTPPNKIMVYPEQLPDRIQKRKGRTNLDQFVETLAAEPKFKSFLDLRPVLEKEKKNHQLYLKGDTHWNMEGAYVAYVAIINYINQWFPELKPTPRDQLIRQDKHLSGDLSKILNLPKLFAEDWYLLLIPDYKTKINYVTFSGYPQPDTSYQTFRKGKLFYNEIPDKNLKRKAIFISDSFGSALRDFLAQHFKRIVFVKDARFEDMKRLIEIEKPDIVFDLNVARGLYVAVGESIDIRNYVIDKHAGSRTSLADIDSTNMHQLITELVQLDAAGEQEQMIFQAQGNDPQIIVNIGEGVNTGPLLVHCNITAPADTTFMIYYKTASASEFNAADIVSQRIRKGPNSICLRIYDKIKLDSLRIDPGDRSGRYTVDRISFEIEHR